ncbi:hypothetical protein Cgig2_009949 [Carnegiea gigantea]|uniref:RRM domain-containing protein n=1 Tax=Carnegiea gigantea TaxID=171969 RepID=A0A9Q1GZ87_9CARY|nr:hypothetical protein Cgig2_009949 [Carnegiea gigantea]
MNASNKTWERIVATRGSKLQSSYESSFRQKEGPVVAGWHNRTTKRLSGQVAETESTKAVKPQAQCRLLLRIYTEGVTLSKGLMPVQCSINDHDMKALQDTEATHNFISVETTKSHKLAIRGSKVQIESSLLDKGNKVGALVLSGSGFLSTCSPNRMAIHGGAYEKSTQVRFKALKGELQHLVLSFSEDSIGQGGDSCASMAAFDDRAREVISIMRELKGLPSKPLPLLMSSCSANQKMSYASGFLSSSRFIHVGINGDHHKERTSSSKALPNREPIPETLGNTSKVYSIFVDSLSADLGITNFTDLFSSCEEVVDAYIPNNYRRKSGRKYGFIRYVGIQEGLKAIEHLNGKSVGDYKLHVMWVRYPKRLPATGRRGSSSTRKKTVWNWIPRANNVPNHHSSSPYKQALLSNPN